MILVCGGYCQGKLAWAREWFELSEAQIRDGGVCSPEELFAGQEPLRALNHFHLLVRRWLEQGEDAGARTRELVQSCPGLIILTDEIGSGIIPMDASEREWREVHGRICCRLAQEADAVIRLVCGVPSWIKGDPGEFTIRVIRHGQTYGNTKRRFLGKTDEGLWQGGIEALEELRRRGVWGEAEEGALFSSPMLRCRQTAQILFPGTEPCLLPGMRECDFGIMENKNHEELDGDPRYQAWIDSGGYAPFPGGESLETFGDRVVSAFDEMVNIMAQRGIKDAALVCHGGSIMAMMSRIARPSREYFTGIKGNGCGYLIKINYHLWKSGKKYCSILKEVGE